MCLDVPNIGLLLELCEGNFVIFLKQSENFRKILEKYAYTRGANQYICIGTIYGGLGSANSKGNGIPNEK